MLAETIYPIAVSLSEPEKKKLIALLQDDIEVKLPTKNAEDIKRMQWLKQKFYKPKR